MKITIPGGHDTRPYHVVKQGDTMWKIARMHGITLQQLIDENPQIQDPNKLTVGMKVYLPTSLFHRHVVKAGETLWTIAQKYHVDFQELKAANPQLTNPDVISPGDIIWVPKHTVSVQPSYLPLPDLDIPDMNQGWQLESNNSGSHHHPTPPAHPSHPSHPSHPHQPHQGYPIYLYPVWPAHPWHEGCCPYCRKSWI
ncbi:LysM peptidoglycan-binding domain-containing protein [Chryseomicrobium palamuruense]|uniref:LysM peptidoglycan-binding domain-containing protein n=1 Tax=Chryseomicrobium palamuruense TaxID=682973 RepID=A0ABV8UXI5_9BACL